MKKVVVLSGSIRKGRQTHFVAQTITSGLRGDKNINTVFLDLKDHLFPILEERSIPMEEDMQRFSDELSSADGIIIVTPEYKNGIPGALKNTLDHLAPQVFKHIPIGIVTVSSGNFGGVFCLSQLRLVVLALGGLPIPEKLCVSKVNEVYDESGKLNDDSFQKKTVDFIDAMMWYVNRLG